jgi:phosphatidylserine/phosphatidylglycerophosphate/cardiolipin synthase-like enzyme
VSAKSATGASTIEVRTLTDGGQTALAIATEIAAFLSEARRSLDIALYDIRVDGPEAQPLTQALLDAHARGVRVRILYNVNHPGPIPVPPPPTSVPEALEALPVETRAIAGVPDLMHHKYAVRDGEHVFTGSTNWTEDSWTRQENVMTVVRSPEIAYAYTLDFDQLWESGLVEASGDVDPRAVELAGSKVRAWFTPGRAQSLAHRIANKIDRARRRVRVCSPVISSGPILGTLAQVTTDERCDLTGVVDGTQIRQVVEQWRANGNADWKIPLLENVIERGGFTGKHSTPWGPGTVHDYMHAKVTVADDTIFLGSFNLSRSGEMNAENVLEIVDPELAERLAAYIDEIRARYPAVELPGIS